MGELAEMVRGATTRDVDGASKGNVDVARVDVGRAPAIDRVPELRARGAQANADTEFTPTSQAQSAPRQLEVPPAVQEYMSQISRSQTFQKMSVAQQQKFVETLDAVLRFEDSRRDCEKIVRDFTALLDRRIEGEPALLQTDRSGTGNTLLDNLHTLATHERNLLEPALRDQRDRLIRSLVTEMIHSDQEVNQGETATCVPTTANRAIAAERPAEYARIIMELATTGQAGLYYDNPETGRSERSSSLGLRMPSGSSSADWLQGRSVSEAMFQDSAMEMVGGYSDGLYSNQIEILYEGLWGKPFVRLDAGQDVIGALRETCDAGLPSMVSMQWEAQGMHANHALEVRAVVSAEDIQRIGDRDVIVIGKEPNQTLVPVDRALRRELSEGDVVIARNPWGSEYPNPSGIGAHTIDKDSALFWMKDTTFESRVNFVMVADNTRGTSFGVTEGGSWGEGTRTEFVMNVGGMAIGVDLSGDIKKILAPREDTSMQGAARRKGASHEAIQGSVSSVSEGAKAETSALSVEDRR